MTAHRDYMRAWKAARKAAGLCCVCQAPAVATRCPVHEAIHNAQARRYRQDPAEKMKRCAREAVRRAVASGRLVKPEICPSCQQPRPVQAHHADYARRLDVTWLCSGCHGQLHRKAA